MSIDNKHNSIESKLYFREQNELLRRYDFTLGDLAHEKVYLDGFDIYNDIELYSEDDQFFAQKRIGMAC